MTAVLVRLRIFIGIRLRWSVSWIVGGLVMLLVGRNLLLMFVCVGMDMSGIRLIIGVLLSVLKLISLLASLQDSIISVTVLLISSGMPLVKSAM